MEPRRTCLGCRARDDRSALLRIVVSGDAIVPDTSGTAPGRGAWVHPTRDCVQRAIRRRAFGRALRTDAVLDHDRILALIDAHPGIREEQADRPMDN
ncbi:YlxR family protein [Galbitalea sp. SE-J8]|uniref:YlxR family protein n=1 Tax=Galbitalea sp. SE-J8 TaxID=3054952 RepID=UPI00259CAFD8|nr:YlxR family protein [Galbitalea sp. SE-J8]MDM4763505.1 YlxR family protein [Galbitalea sp. SE-J8]